MYHNYNKTNWQRTIRQTYIVSVQFNHEKNKIEIVIEFNP